MRPCQFRPVEIDFVEQAPSVLTSTAVIAHPIVDVFSALSGDPATWTWFPGFSSRGRWLTPWPHGAGSIREVQMAGITYTETMLAWEEPDRWAFRVDTATVPLARALVEDYRLESVGAGTDAGKATRLRWIFAIEPPGVLRPWFSRPAAGGAMQRLCTRFAANLERRLAGP